MPIGESGTAAQNASGSGIGDGVIQRRPDQDAFMVEVIPTSASPLLCTVQVLDSALEGAGFNPTWDTAGLQTNITGYKKFAVGGVLEFGKVNLTIVSGTWTVRMTPIRLPGLSSSAIGSPLPTGSNTIGVTQSTIESMVRAGKAFVWSPGRLAPASGNGVQLLISNPNVITLYLYAHFFTDDLAGVVLASLFKNPSVGLPTLGAVGAGIANQNEASGFTSVMQVGSGISATALAVGTGSALTTEPIVGVSRQAYPAPLYIVGPGETLGFQIPVGATTPGITPEFFWWESA